MKQAMRGVLAGGAAWLLVAVGRAATPAGGDENTWDPKRGLRLSARVLAELGVTVEEVTERKVTVVHRAALRLVAASGRGRAVAQVAADEARWWPRGANTRIRGDGVSRPLNATVGAVDRTMAVTGGMVEVLLALNQPVPEAARGALGTAEVSASAGPGVFVPRRDVLERNGGSFVYVVNEGYYQRVSVKTGVRTETWVEVTDGLLEGDEVAAGDVVQLWMAELRAGSSSDGRCCPL